MKLWPSLVLLGACASPAVSAPPAVPSSVAGALAPPAVKTVNVKGHVLDADGNPMKLAHVVVVDAAKKKLATAAVAADGGFSLALPGTKDRIVTLEASGVDHEPSRPLLANDGGGARVDFRLGTYPAQVPPAIALSLRHGKDKSEPPRPMPRQADGTYSLDLPTADGAYTYEICGYAKHRCVNGTAGNAFARDSEDDYRSELTFTGGHSTWCSIRANRSRRGRRARRPSRRPEPPELGSPPSTPASSPRTRQCRRSFRR